MLLDARLNSEAIQQPEAFVIAYRDLNTCLHQLTNLNHGLGGFREYLVPFNDPPSPPRLSASSLTTLEAPSYVDKSPGSLDDDPNDW